MDAVSDTEALDHWRDEDLMEAVIACERHLGLGETDDERLIRCRTVGDLIAVFGLAE